MKRLMLLHSIRRHLPLGQQWQCAQMRRVLLLGLRSQSARPRADHGGGSFCPDTSFSCVCICATLFSHCFDWPPPHLAFKFPDQLGSRALVTRRSLRLNSLRGSYSDDATHSLPSRLGRLLWDTLQFCSGSPLSSVVISCARSMSCTHCSHRTYISVTWSTWKSISSSIISTYIYIYYTAYFWWRIFYNHRLLSSDFPWFNESIS